jgi:hypothetical protein
MTKAQAGEMSNMPKLAKSYSGNAQEDYTPTYDKSPSRRNVKQVQAGKNQFRRTEAKEGQERQVQWGNQASSKYSSPSPFLFLRM